MRGLKFRESAGGQKNAGNYNVSKLQITLKHFKFSWKSYMTYKANN
jgi:hypothetical protein